MTRTTTRMTAEQLARTWAAEHGIVGRPGGWLYDGKGRPVCQGWARLADALIARRLIEVGVGVNWQQTHRLGGPLRVAATIAATRRA